MEKREMYLGDSVYASNDGFHIILEADGHKQIFLEDKVLENLFRYVELVYNLKIKVIKNETAAQDD